MKMKIIEPGTVTISAVDGVLITGFTFKGSPPSEDPSPLAEAERLVFGWAREQMVKSLEGGSS